MLTGAIGARLGCIRGAGEGLGRGAKERGRKRGEKKGGGGSNGSYSNSARRWRKLKTNSREYFKDVVRQVRRGAVRDERREAL